MSSAAFLPDMSIPPKIGPMRYPPMTLFALMPQAVKIPVIGMGGIMNGDDAIEFFLAGASAVAVGTANFVDPFAPLKVIDGINAYLDRHGYSSIRDIVGKLEI